MEVIVGFISKLLEKSEVTLFAVALATGIILFSPTIFIETIGITKIHADYKTYLGIIFLLSSCSTVTIFGSKKWNEFFGLKAWHRTLDDLSEEEKNFLNVYIQEKKSTQTSNISDGVTCGLEIKTIIIRTSNMSTPGTTNFPYSLQPWARDYLTKRPELLKINEPD